ncbi:hypothetical protein [Ignicoccus hospitalis]|uniref:Uncharacterized protein n=1 Tax=Ignicoccus hospitalis (strain KIN4/I / DSM 18386 / JCM 14125) TaxID=453591 RepID=A8AB50_IGNH4|nr:hypothetical protein [Ignicoccus hospitalis]ABU82152.1 hypothetical protein Igni_0972 [Ignicoccus hospitalis KIN4/I]HIH91110.1 hypothetical protein [Desulfurococcaceae archaeon]
MWEWFVVGLVSSLLDQTLALGFGLTSSLILVSALGADPREVVPTILAAQALTSVPAYLIIRKLKVPSQLFLFLLVTSVMTVILPFGLKALKTKDALALYSLSLFLTVAIMVAMDKGFLKPDLKATLLLSLLVSLDKVMVGGGLSLALVILQKSMGVSLSEALMSLPVIKALPVLTSLIGYCGSSLCPRPAPSFAMAAGAALGSYASKKLHSKIRIRDEYSVLLLLIGAAVSALRALY